MYKSLSCILGLFCIFIACQSKKNNDQSSVASDTQFHVEPFREINLADHLSDCGEELLMSVLKVVFFLILWFLIGIFILPFFLKKA